MNGYLFDTNIVSFWFQQKPAITSRVAAIPNGNFLYISAVTIGEIEFGHLNINAKDPAKQAAFRRWIAETFHSHRLEITNATAGEYAKLKRAVCDTYFKKNKYIELHENAQAHVLGVDENDLWIVSQAYEHGLKFVTCDKMTRIKEVLGHMVDVSTWPQV